MSGCVEFQRVGSGMVEVTIRTDELRIERDLGESDIGEPVFVVRWTTHVDNIRRAIAPPKKKARR